MNVTQQNHWLSTTLGQHLLNQEQQLYDSAVGDMFGFNAMQLGFLQLDALKNSRIPHIIHVGNSDGDVYCESDYLPLAESCIDLICLPHVLEFSENPHQTLREAERVLVPEGCLVLTGFNPISAWGLKHAMSKEPSYPWNGHFFTLSRIKDWLALLGLELMSVQMHGYEPPINNAQWLNRFKCLDKVGSQWWPMMGGIYFIVAKKRVVNITLLKPNWKKNSLKSRLAVSQSQKNNTQKNHSNKPHQQ